MAEVARQQVIGKLKQKGGGSVLRGWRVELDPDGSLDVNFLEFCQAAQRLQISVDVAVLFGEDSPNELELCELVPAEAKLVDDFRQWLTDEFGGPGDMFAGMEVGDSNEGRLSRSEFVDGCRRRGFYGSKAQLGEIFNLLDLPCVDSIGVEDVMFLDLDPKRREGAIRKVKLRGKIEHDRLLSNFYKDLQKQSLKNGHRLAPRGWHAPSLEKLPEVVIEKRQEWRKREKRRRKGLIQTWERKVKETYGSTVRTWRRGLDRDQKFVISRGEFGQFCRRLNLEVVVNQLWNLVDRDGDDLLRIEDMCSEGAAVLARYRKWQAETFSSADEAWRAIMAAAKPAPNWKSSSSLQSPAFNAAIKALNWSGAKDEGTGPGTGPDLCRQLDMNGCGIVSKTDLEWISKWDPPEWLWKQADPEAWAQLSSLFLYHYGKPLKAWRQIDKDDSNQVSWLEFNEGCDEVGFDGNRGGAWRALDVDVSGTISMTEWHLPSAELMLSFKEWMDAHFGSVKYGFRILDTDNSGSVSFSELKRACKRMGWEGDVRLVFECLNVDVRPGQRTLSFKELAFLDSWEPALDDIAIGNANYTPPSTANSQTRPSRSSSCPAGGLQPQLAAASSRGGSPKAEKQMPSIPRSPSGPGKPSRPPAPTGRRPPPGVAAVRSSKPCGIGSKREEMLANLRVDIERMRGQNATHAAEHQDLLQRTALMKNQSLPILSPSARSSPDKNMQQPVGEAWQS